MVAPVADDRAYIQYDVTEIERSEELLEIILVIAWIVLLVVMFVIARILSKRLSGPIQQLSQELSRINPDERGIQLSHRFEDDVGHALTAGCQEQDVAGRKHAINVMHDAEGPDRYAAQGRRYMLGVRLESATHQQEARSDC